MPYAAKAYLRNSDTLQVVRVLGRDTAAAGEVVLLAFPDSGAVSAAVTSTNTTVGILRYRGTVEDAQISGTPSNFAISIGSVTATGLSLVESSESYIKKVLGTDPTEVKSGDSVTALYVDSVFDWKVGSVTGSVSAETANAGFASATADYSNITGGFAESQTPTIVSQNFGGTVYDLFKVYSLAHGPDQNTEFKISITQVDNSTTSSPKFSLVVRDFNDTDTQPVIFESFTNLVLDPSSKQYVGRVIGDRKTTYDLTQNPPELLFDGDYANKSKYIRVEVYDGFPGNARPSGFSGVPKIGPDAALPDLPTKLNQLNSISNVDNNIFMGIDFTQGGVKDGLKKTTTSASGTSSANTGVLFVSTTAELNLSASNTSYSRVDMVGSNSSNFSTTNALRFTVPMYGGWDGFDPRSDLRVDSNDGTLSADYEKLLRHLQIHKK